jgi:hypothetical protein
MLKRGIEVGATCARADDAGEQAAALGYRRALEHDIRCGAPCPEPEGPAGAAGLIAPAAGRPGAPYRHVFGYALVLGRLAGHTRNLGDLENAIRWLRRAVGYPGAPARARRYALNVLARQLMVHGALLEGADGATELAQLRDEDRSYAAMLTEFAACQC